MFPEPLIGCAGSVSCAHILACAGNHGNQIQRVQQRDVTFPFVWVCPCRPPIRQLQRTRIPKGHPKGERACRGQQMEGHMLGARSAKCTHWRARGEVSGDFVQLADCMVTSWGNKPSKPSCRWTGGRLFSHATPATPWLKSASSCAPFAEMRAAGRLRRSRLASHTLHLGMHGLLLRRKDKGQVPRDG